MKIPFIQKIKQLSAALASHFASKPAPTPVRCNNILALVHHLCDYDHAKATWLLRWLAYPLKNPGARMDTAVLVTGDQGTCKSMLFERVMVQIYHHAASVIEPWQLSSRQNYWADHKRLVVVDGYLSPLEVAHAKSYLACSSVVLQSRGQDPREQQNRMNFVFMTKDVEVLPDHLKSNRFFLLDVPPPLSGESYRAIAHEIENGGGEAFLDFLMRLDMGNFNARSPAPAAFNAEAA
ncbi:MAG: primase-helicase family protein [Massilia sp.]